MLVRLRSIPESMTSPGLTVNKAVLQSRLFQTEAERKPPFQSLALKKHLFGLNKAERKSLFQSQAVRKRLFEPNEAERKCPFQAHAASTH